jgi:hypothetical protein
MISLMLHMACLQGNCFAQDTVSVEVPARRTFKPEPQKATMLAVAFPGLGQIYNRKYWKIPLVYAGFGGLIFSVGFNSSNYNKYLQAYQDFTDLIPETNSYQKLILEDPSTYDPVLHPDTYRPSSASYYQDGMLRMVDYYKRYRDLSYIGIAAWYLISILDANVDASLFDYDIGTNLNLSMSPLQINNYQFTGAGINICMTLNF